MIMFQSGHNVESTKILPIYFFIVQSLSVITSCFVLCIYTLLFQREHYLPF